MNIHSQVRRQGFRDGLQYLAIPIPAASLPLALPVPTHGETAFRQWLQAGAQEEASAKIEQA